MPDTTPDRWREFVRRYRLRHGLTQARLADLIGVSQRTVSRWELGQDRPGLEQQRRLRDLAAKPAEMLMSRLASSVRHCPAPRALSRTQNLRLQAVSPLAIAKRPSITEWIGRDLAPIACGGLKEMLDDRPLQKSIADGEIACVLATTRSVLETKEHPRIGTYETTISYFFHEGTLYSDAISVRAPRNSVLGYRPVPMDDLIGDD
jgi:transcriptional regulator with XRE-family HTH domain